VLALLAIAAVLLPGAQVTLSPDTQAQEIVLEAQAGPGIEAANLSGLIPAHTVPVVVEGRDRLRASGTVRIPDKTASGRVVLTNLTDHTVSVPIGSVIRTLKAEPIRFETTQAMLVPAGPGQARSVPVRALLPGKSGNLPAGSLVGIEGPLGLKLTADNPSPTRGGTDRPGTAPSQDDYEQLFEQLQETLVRPRSTSYPGAPRRGTRYWSARPGLARVVEQVYDPAQPESLPTGWSSLRLEFQ
jgi:hypothetical protein